MTLEKGCSIWHKQTLSHEKIRMNTQDKDQAQSAQIKLIDVRKVAAAKLKRPLPRFVTRFLEKWICQDEINYVLSKYGHLEGIEFARQLIEYFNIHLSFKGVERLPKDPRQLFICNHPLGALDGICLTVMIAEHYQTEIRYIVNDMLLNLEPFRHIFVPVNTLGAQSRESVVKLNEALAVPYPVITFPAGVCSRKINGEIMDLPWKNSYIRQATRYERNIVPLYFDGYNSKRFYQTELWRKRLGVKFNIGTTMLPQEMFKSKGNHYTVLVGDPISYKDLQERKERVDVLSKKIRAQVYSLPSFYLTEDVKPKITTNHEQKK